MSPTVAIGQSNLPPCPNDKSLLWHNCQGTYTFTDGSKYVGEWKDGKQNGQGAYTFPDGTKYVGGFKDGQRKDGQGTMTFPDGSKYVGEFIDSDFNGQGTYTLADGTKYVGDYKDGKRNGQGTLTLLNGAKYVGEFRDGEANGQGTMTLADGSKYVGDYKDGKRNGQGTETYADGSKYVGEFKDGEENGQGTYTFPDGSKYVGAFKDGVPNGQGTETYADGSKYVGEWKDGKENGQGTLYAADGSVVFSGRWAENKPAKLGLFSEKGGKNHLWTVQVVNTGEEFVCDAFATGQMGRPPYEFRFRRSKSGLTLVLSYDGPKLHSPDEYATIIINNAANTLPAVAGRFGKRNAFFISIDPYSFKLSIFKQNTPIQISIGATMFNLMIVENDHVEQAFADCLRAIHLN
jgi:hypothetical protein